MPSFFLILRIQSFKACTNSSINSTWRSGVISDYLNDFENTVSNLQDSKSKELGITWLDTDGNGSYLIFYEPEHLNILGVLKAKSSPGKQSTQGDNFNEYKGHSPGCQKYPKGELVKTGDYQ